MIIYLLREVEGNVFMRIIPRTPAILLKFAQTVNMINFFPESVGLSEKNSCVNLTLYKAFHAVCIGCCC